MSSMHCKRHQLTPLSSFLCLLKLGTKVKTNTSKLVFILLALFCLFPAFHQASAAGGCDGAGNCYIYASANGSGTGVNWTNAYKGFGTGAGQVNPASMTRGVTYWIANGNYGPVTFSTPDSGTSVITIEGATTSSHGPASDWSNSYAGQALFAATAANTGTFITTDYWTFNGQTRGSDWQSGYTIKFWNEANTQTYSNGYNEAISLSGNNVTFQYVEMCGTGQYMSGGTLVSFPSNTATADKCSVNNCGNWSDDAIFTPVPVSNLYVGHCYAHHTGGVTFQMDATLNNAGQTAGSNLVWEYNWIAYNHTGMNGQHDEAYSLYGSNVTIRYNVFQDICSTGIITTAGAGSAENGTLPHLSNWDIYGNLFFWDSTYAALNGQYGLATLDDGIVSFLGEKMSGYIHFYNNTISGIYNSYMDQQGTGASTMPLAGLFGGK